MHERNHRNPYKTPDPAELGQLIAELTDIKKKEDAGDLSVEQAWIDNLPELPADDQDTMVEM